MKCPLTRSTCPLGLGDCDMHSCSLLSSFLFSESGIMLLILDRHGKVKYVNDSITKVTKYKKGELYRKSWVDLLIPDEEKEIVQIVFERTLNMSEKVTFINNIIDKDGEAHLIAWNNYMIMNGNPNIVCIGIPVTRNQYVIDHLKAEINDNSEEATLESVLNKAVNRLTMLRQLNPLS